MRALRGLGVALLVSTTLFLCALQLDRHLVLSTVSRVLLSAGVTAAAAASALFLLARPFLRPLPPLRAARGLEAALPSLEEGLLTTLELKEGRLEGGVSSVLSAAVARTTADRLRAVKAARLVDARPLLWLWAGVGGLAALLALAALDFRSFSLLGERFVHPLRDLPRPSRVGLVVLPGNAVVGLDDDFLVQAAVTRGAPREVKVRFRVPGGEWRVAAMESAARRATPPAPRVAALPSGAAAFWHEFRRIRQTFEYQAIAGDAASPVHRVEARERPRAETFAITYRFPETTRRTPVVSISPRGDLSAVAGTVAELEATCSGRPTAARLLGAGDLSLDPSPLPLDLDGEGRVRVLAEITILKSGSYRLLLEDADGVSNREGVSFSIHAEADRPPRVLVLSPRAAEVVVEDPVRLRLELQAEDDFGVEELALTAGDPAAKESRFPIPLERASAASALVSVSYAWDLLPLGLEPGTSLPFRIVARDGKGQLGASTEMVLRVSFTPDPPEGGGWLAGLGGIEGRLLRAREELKSILGGPGGERASSFAIDPARAERLARSGDELSGLLSRIAQIGNEVEALGRSIPIPSVNRRALPRLGASLRRFGDEEGKVLWREMLALSGRIREALARRDQPSRGEAPLEVPAADLNAALDRALERIASTTDRFRTIYRAERLEAGLERARSLLAAEEVLRDRARDRATAPAAGGSPAPAPPASPPAGDAQEAAARRQRALRVEGTLLAADLDGLSRLGGTEDPGIASAAQAYLNAVIPALEAAQRAVDSRDAGASAEALEGVARTLRPSLDTLEEELARAETAARAARAALAQRPAMADRLTALSAAEAGVASLVEDGGPESLARAVALDGARRPEEILLAREIEEEAQAAESAEPADFESARDLLSIRDVFRGLKESSLEAAARETEELSRSAALPAATRSEDLKALAKKRKHAAGVLEGLARAAREVQPGVELGARARGLEANAGAAEAVALRLRSTAPGHRRSLRTQAGIERELAIGLREIGEGLEALSGTGAGAEPAEALGAARAETAQAAEAALRSARACLAGDPSRALEESLESALHAGDAARRSDEARGRLVGLAAVRTWLQRQLGSLAERIERLAREEENHGRAVDALRAGQGGREESARSLLQPERLAALALDQSLLCGEAERLAVAAAQEAGRLSSAPAGGRGPRKAAAVRALDFAADRLIALGRGEMLRARQSIDGASQASSAGRQLDLLAEAAAGEKQAAEGLLAVAKALRLLEENEAAALAETDLEDLLSSFPPASGRPIEKVLREARALLEGTLRAAATLAARLPEGVLKAEILDDLRKAAEKFRGAVAAGEEGDPGAAEALLGEGRDLLQSAILLAKRLRGETDRALAEARAEEEKEPEGEKPISRELAEVYAELERIQALRDRQAGIEAQLEDLLREPLRDGKAEKFKELARLEQALAEEAGERFLTTSRLTELVAELLAAGNEAKRIGEAERRLLDAPARASGAGERGPRESQESLSRETEAMAKKVRQAGTSLTINLPAILKPFWEAESRLEPAASAQRRALELMSGPDPSAARAEIQRAGAELGLLSDLLAAARRRALEEIAAREDETAPSVDAGSLGMEEAVSSLREAARNLAGGRPEEARSLLGSSARGMTSAAQALRARLDRLRLDPRAGAGSLSSAIEETSRLRGLSWEVPLRGDEPDKAHAGEGKPAGSVEDSLDSFPEEYRELVRIYLRALAE